MFRSDRTDLDFGIYRILNHKRDAIEGFIRDTLPGKIKADLEGEYRQKEQASDRLKDVARRVKATLGHDAIGPDGDLNETYRKLPLGIEYQQAKEQAADMGARASMESDIYNHLYAFFNRYYQDGDFVSKRRISGGHHRYTVPYNGEEVYLHWANSDQYYVKTAEHFRDYNWKTPDGSAVRFEIRKADVEHDNVKGDKRFFLPLVDEMQWDETGKKAVIPFEYRPLTPREGKEYGKGGQSKIVSAAVRDILNGADGISRDLAAALRSERGGNGKGAVSHLEHHLLQYPRSNTSDFFVHKDLKGFLSRELDTYLKSEVLNLDEMESAGERNAAGWFQKMRLIKSVGGKIIDFLAQVEDFQKMLWEKRKFVAETHYCVAVGGIDPKFYPVITGNRAQCAEWQQLLDIDIGSVGRKADFLKKHPALMVDTKHFDRDFVDCLLASFGDLDGATDMLLINGDGFQALNLLMTLYHDHIDSIYIDPPYNTDSSRIIYKNDYEHSSWLSLLENRLSASNRMLTDGGVLCCAIDDEEVSKLRLVLGSIFAKDIGVAVVRSNPSGRKTSGKFAPSHEYAIFVGSEKSSPGVLPKTEKQYAAYKEKDEGGSRFVWTNLIRSGSNSERKNRPHMYFPIYVSDNNKMRVPKMEWDRDRNEYDVLEEPGPNETVVLPISKGREMCWHRGYERVSRELTEYRVRRNDTINIDFKKYMDVDAKPKTWWDSEEYEGDESVYNKDTMWGDSKYASSIHAPKTLKNLFGFKNFDFAKSVSLVRDCIMASGCREVCLDYFAGSGTTGHAIIDLNRTDGKRRRCIMAEVGRQFDAVILPRMKKVVYTPEWKEGKPKRMATTEEAERGPRIIKYMRLESYEDALDNIEFGSGGQSQVDRFGDYLLKYMLKWETKGSKTLLNVDRLASPFSYTLRLRADGESKDKAVDIPETFNYLLGLNVRSRRAYDDNGRRYLVYRGRTRGEPGRDVAVIWRETAGWKKEDFERDKAFVKKHGLAAEDGSTYVNGDSLIPGARPVEGLFRDRMFDGMGA